MAGWVVRCDECSVYAADHGAETSGGAIAWALHIDGWTLTEDDQLICPGCSLRRDTRRWRESARLQRLSEA